MSAANPAGHSLATPAAHGAPTSSLLWRMLLTDLLFQSHQREQKTLCLGATKKSIWYFAYLVFSSLNIIWLSEQFSLFTLKRMFLLLWYLFQNCLTCGLPAPSMGQSQSLKVFTVENSSQLLYPMLCVLQQHEMEAALQYSWQILCGSS